MRMRDVLWQIWLNCGYFLTVAASGFFLYKLCAPFVRPRNGRFWLESYIAGWIENDQFQKNEIRSYQ